MRGADYNDLGKALGLEFHHTLHLKMADGPMFATGVGGDAYINIIKGAGGRDFCRATVRHVGPLEHEPAATAAGWMRWHDTRTCTTRWTSSI